MLENTPKTIIAIKQRPIRTSRSALPNDSAAKSTSHGQGTGTVRFVNLLSNPKKSLSQYASAKPGTRRAMKSVGAKPTMMPAAQSTTPVTKPGSVVRFMLRRAITARLATAPYTPWLQPKTAANPTHTPTQKWPVLVGLRARKDNAPIKKMDTEMSNILWYGNIHPASVTADRSAYRSRCRGEEPTIRYRPTNRPNA